MYLPSFVICGKPGHVYLTLILTLTLTLTLLLSLTVLLRLPREGAQLDLDSLR
jgi:hypothetical protein